MRPRRPQHGGYRLYSARATLAYSAPYIVTDEVAAAANPFDPLAVVNVHPVIDSESFTYLMDHTHMTPDVNRRLELTFTGNSTPLVVHDGDTERNPDAVGAINEAGYAASSPYTEVLIDIDDIAIPVENTGQNLSAYAEEQVPVQADSGFTTVDGIPNLPVVLTSRTQGMPRVSQEELGNYFVVPLGPNAAGSQFARSDPNGVGHDDHVEFRNFYWNFADNRPMFLLFNNWSREASRQEGAWGAQPLPVPIAFSFNSEDARLIQQPGYADTLQQWCAWTSWGRCPTLWTRHSGTAGKLRHARERRDSSRLFSADGGGVYERQLARPRSSTCARRS